MIGIIPLSTFLYKNQIINKNLRDYLIFYPPFITLFWLTLLIISVKRRKLFYFLLTLFFVFIFLPLGFLYPLNEINSFSNYNVVSLVIKVIAW